MSRIQRGTVSAQRGGGGGRRDPETARRIRADEPVYTDDAPEGAVRRRARPQEPPEPEPAPGEIDVDLDSLTDAEYQQLVDDGYIAAGDSGVVTIEDPGMEPPEEALISGDGESYPDSPAFMVEGDFVYAKVHHPVRFDEDPSNFTYGIACRVQSGETESEAFERVEAIVNQRSLDLARRAYEPVLEFKDDVARARKERVNARRGLRQKEAE